MIQFKDIHAKYVDAIPWLYSAAGVLLLVPASYLYRYRRSVKKRVKQLEQDFSSNLMVRDPSRIEKKFRILVLNPEFVKKHKSTWQLMSLGDYLSSIRPNAVLPEGVDTPKFIQHEMEVLMGGMFLNYLGPRLGAAILPLLGFQNVQTTTARIAARIANWFASHFIVGQMQRDEELDPTADKGVLPISLYDMSAFANINRNLRGESSMEQSPLELLKHGEVAYEPTFTADLVPNPFIIEEHWDKAWRGMEDLMREAKQKMRPTPDSEAVEIPLSINSEFDPDDRSYPEPTPINPRLFPDLYFGWGSAKCTHTKREIIRNRLLAVLLNKLSYNIVIREKGIEDQPLFVVKMKEGGNEIVTADGFVRALVDAGHEMEVCPRGTITTFGVAMCVKEKDGSWSNIPLACFARSGYESEGMRPAHVSMPHGGMDLSIKGPLVGSNCKIQFYMAIEGMCGWHSNHNADVPWIVATASTQVYDTNDALRAVRMASLLAVTFNSIGTEQKLPFGGYGVLGVCSDTAALLDQAIRGTTNLYPLISTGAYLMHIARRLGKLHNGLSKHADLEEESTDMMRLMAATMDISSDLHAAPSNVLDDISRYLTCLPETSVFQMEVESKEILTTLLHSFEEYRRKRPQLEEEWDWKKRIGSFRKRK